MRCEILRGGIQRGKKARLFPKVFLIQKMRIDENISHLWITDHCAIRSLCLSSLGWPSLSEGENRPSCVKKIKSLIIHYYVLLGPIDVMTNHPMSLSIWRTIWLYSHQMFKHIFPSQLCSETQWTEVFKFLLSARNIWKKENAVYWAWASARSLRSASFLAARPA